jgi:hypothetical protein
VLSVTMIGALMAAIDINIVILGLPEMLVDLHADLVEMIWVITAYILISTRVPSDAGVHRRHEPRFFRPDCSLVFWPLGSL